MTRKNISNKYLTSNNKDSFTAAQESNCNNIAADG